MNSWEGSRGSGIQTVTILLFGGSGVFQFWGSDFFGGALEGENEFWKGSLKLGAPGKFVMYRIWSLHPFLINV
jgi:hypothetical protein